MPARTVPESMKRRQAFTLATSNGAAKRSFVVYRRQRANEAIAYIERCYREGRAIPNVR